VDDSLPPADPPADPPGEAPDQAAVPADAGPAVPPPAPGARSLSRRTVLVALAGSAAAAAGAGWVLLPDRRRASTASPDRGSGSATASLGGSSSAPLRPGEGIVVLLTLYGGNDGLNTVVPAGDPAYLQGRGALAYQAADVLPLGEGLGLNPSLTGLKALWDDHRLAVVRGVGYPNPNRSHFRSMDIWQSAVPDRPVITGWLGRWLDTQPHDPMRAIAVGGSVPLALVGATTSAAAVNVGPLTLPGGAPLAAAYSKLVAASASDSPLARLVATSGSDLVIVEHTLGQVLAATPEATAAGGTSLEVGQAATSSVAPASPTTTAKGAATKPAAANALAGQLDLVARAILGGATTRVYATSLGGFDTHANEKATQARQLALLDEALTSFLGRLGTDPRGAGVVVVVHSEFGRRVAANASGGTDHGTAGPVFVAGPSVRGGFYGAEPSLTDLDAGDLKFTTDFRSVYATVLAHVLGADPAAILGGRFAPLGFV